MSTRQFFLFNARQKPEKMLLKDRFASLTLTTDFSLQQKMAEHQPCHVKSRYAKYGTALSATIKSLCVNVQVLMVFFAARILSDSLKRL
jgi:hypothetical protein